MARVKRVSRAIKKSTLKTIKQKRPYTKNKFITPRQLKNFINDNTLQDWLERYYTPKPKPVSKYMEEIKSAYRNYVINELKVRIQASTDSDLDLVVLDRPDTSDINTGEELSEVLNGQETLKHIKAGTGVIANAQLVHRSEGLCDVVDLLVRADLISILFPECPTVPTLEAQNRYVCVGISIARHTFCVDGMTLRNNPSVRYWKTKLCIANRILTYYQQAEHDASYALLLGRGFTWTMSKKDGGAIKKGDDFGRPGIIGFMAADQFVDDLIVAGTGWLNRLDDANSETWTLHPTPSHDELYANAKLNIYDTPWAPVIHDIAVKQDNVTLLHHCTTKNRIKAGGKRLADINDSETLGYRGTTKLGKQLNRYLQGDWNKLSDIPLPDLKNYICVDFESAHMWDTSTGTDAPTLKEWIYMVSVKVQDDQDPLQFGFHSESMLPKDLSKIRSRDYQQTVEKHIAEQLVNVFNQHKYPIVCWGDAELRYINLLATRYPEYQQLSDHLCKIINLLELFQTNDIILKGQTDCSLSTVSKVMNLEDSSKSPVNTHDLLYRVIGGDMEALKQLTEYNNNDTVVLEAMLQKIHNARYG